MSTATSSGTVAAPPRVLRTIADVRAAVAEARRAGRRIGFVPTMGALHEGHLSLMRRARSECGFVVMSIFVNPTQFNDAADLEKYPRDEAGDVAMAGDVGVDAVFAPAASEIYPAGFETSVTVTGVSEPWEGAHRGAVHFRGVATVVAKLFNIVAPDVAYFGQKDAQQALVVRRMARDLDFPVEISVCPTIREPDGLAMSSRNVRLGPADRERALALKAGLDAAEAAIVRGARTPADIVRTATAVMRARDVEPEYVAVVDAETLAEPTAVKGQTLIAVAAQVGPVRLIDNILLDVPA
ncbi:MAG TPA: pantoate--beta-alanine ligase [Gemmatimonadaceae bacterium]|nr:pantoate--beta-alanine ligase [Gemmatimonadaceae bacterium]